VELSRPQRWLLTVRKYKDPTASSTKNTGTKTETHASERGDAELNAAIRRIRDAATAREGNNLLFPNFTQWAGNKAITVAAKLLNLDSRLQWVNHGIRHGAAVDAAAWAYAQYGDDEGKILAEIRARLVHESDDMKYFYSEPPAVRAIRATIQQQSTPGEFSPRLFELLERCDVKYVPEINQQIEVEVQRTGNGLDDCEYDPSIFGDLLSSLERTTMSKKTTRIPAKSKKAKKAPAGKQAKKKAPAPKTTRKPKVSSGGKKK